MSYNRSYRQHVSQPGRYNSPGHFVAAGELGGNQGTPQRTTRSSTANVNTNFGNLYPSGSNPPPPPPPAPQVTPVPQVAPVPAAPVNQYQVPQQPQSYTEPEPEHSEVKPEQMEIENTEIGGTTRPSWMKNRQLGAGGIKKISNKERRRRQNEHLRRLLAPKNALMVLNELLPGEQLSQNFTVEAAPTNTKLFRQDVNHKFCAGLSLEGSVYKGFGENKLMARNAAAEQAIRDLVIKRMSKAIKGENENMDQNGEATQQSSDEEPLPMMQLASYALHKLFSEWQYEGYAVPLLQRPQTTSTSDKAQEEAAVPSLPSAAKKAPKQPKELPADAASMHPCMLLTQMRQGLVYHELGSEGDKPQNIMFTMGVTVDGTTYIGKASNKKEARKQAARQACQALFNVVFNDSAPV